MMLDLYLKIILVAIIKRIYLLIMFFKMNIFSFYLSKVKIYENQNIFKCKEVEECLNI